MKTYSHLNKEQRASIEHLLNKGYNFTDIGAAINVDRTTISKEIKRNRYLRNSVYNNFSELGIKKAIKSCEYLSKIPYCCNNCKFKSGCCKSHLFYNANEADKHYKENNSISKQGIDITEDSIKMINKNIVPLIKNKNQSINQVYINHPDILYMSKPTFYKYINNGVILLSNIDLPRKVKYKKRKSKKNKNNKRDMALLINRRYEDYEERISKDKKLNIWQLDTVIGLITDNKALMTFLLVETNFMIIRLIDKKDIEHINQEFTNLKIKLGSELYKKVINIILTDNGIEFYDPIHLEYNLKTGEKLCSVYYCHPNSPEEKAELEKNHEYIRYYLPKKTSFNGLTKEEIKLIEDNINNIPREILGDSTPYQLTKEKYPELIRKLNSKYIEPDNVTLNFEDIKNKTMKK